MGRAARVETRDAGHVGGRYRLVEKLGRGGMSVVWRGYDEILGRPVAVKVLSARLAADATFRERLRLEALAAARLCHPHITSIFDYGESTYDGVTVPYVVMELNDGESVSARLARTGALTWREAVGVGVDVASALATAHACGVVHRDVTPANVMLTGAGAKVVDFGISALVGQRDAAPDGSLLGTPAYLAPERLSGAQVSPATDVYALGLLLYRLLTGRMPWSAETTTEALRAHLYADPEPVPRLPGMPEEVSELCLRCLAKAPAERPDAATVAGTLAAAVGLQPVIPPLPLGWLPVPHWADAEQPRTPARAAPRPGAELVVTAAVTATAVAVPTGAIAAEPGLLTAAPAPPAPSPGVPEPVPPADALRRTAGERVRALRRRWVGVRDHVRPRWWQLATATETLVADVAAAWHRDPWPGRRLRRDGLLDDGVLRRAPARPRPFRQSPAHRLVALARETLTAGRRRVNAVAATVVLLMVAAISALPVREQEEVAPPAQAAAPPGAAVVHTAHCRVRFQVQRDSGSEFAAALTITNIGRGALRDWVLEFTFPGRQRLIGASDEILQSGRRVTVRSGGAAPLPPGRSVQVPLRGSYRQSNPLPLRFSLDGRPCRVEVYGTALPTPPDGTDLEAARAARPAAPVTAKPTDAAPATAKPTDRDAGATGTHRTGAAQRSVAGADADQSENGDSRSPTGRKRSANQVVSIST